MRLFPYGHATHPQWQMAVGLVLAQLRAHMALPDYAQSPSLGLLYLTDHYASAAGDLLALLRAELPDVTDWVGSVGIGIAANNVEYIDEPALCVMLCDIDPAHYRVFSGVHPLTGAASADRFVSHTALLHADPQTPDVPELIAELAQRTATGNVFGGLVSSRAGSVQIAWSHQDPTGGHLQGVLDGGLSGVAFDAQVPLLSRITQGCQPVGPVHTITEASQHVVLGLDGEPALSVLMRDLGVDAEHPRELIERIRHTLVGLTMPKDRAIKRTGEFGDAVLVRHILGLDLARKGVAVTQPVEAGMQFTLCQRHVAAARADLMRVGAEIRDALEPEEICAELAHAMHDGVGHGPHLARRMAGAIYISCAGRGGAHFGGPSVELQLVRHALGDVPLVGFFASGEIAHQSLYGYTGVLTVFTMPA